MANLALSVTFSVIYGSLALVGLSGNIMIVSMVLIIKNMLTPTNCYLLSLAFSDLLFFLAVLPVEISYLYVCDGAYVFGSFACHALTYLSYLAINSSALSIIALTVERYIAICYPLKARNLCTVERAKTIIACLWLAATIYNLPWLFLATLRPYNSTCYGREIQKCTYTIERQSMLYKIIYCTDLSFFYVLPMVLFIILFAKILNRLSIDSSSSSTLRAGLSMTANVTAALLSRSTTSKLSKRLDAARIRKTSKASKLLAVVASVFGLCWLPYRAMVFYNSFATETWAPESYILFAKTLVFVNCAINPILYHFVSTKFRRSFKRMVIMIRATFTKEPLSFDRTVTNSRRNTSLFVRKTSSYSTVTYMKQHTVV